MARQHRSSAKNHFQPRAADLRAPLPAERRVLAFAVGTALLPWGVAYADVAANTLPTGGQYAYGSGSINQSGSNLQITQTTGKGTINWNSFSIGSSASVNFTQPSASSITLNRVLGTNPSEIFGRLTANGLNRAPIGNSPFHTALDGPCPARSMPPSLATSPASSDPPECAVSPRPGRCQQAHRHRYTSGAANQETRPARSEVFPSVDRDRKSPQPSAPLQIPAPRFQTHKTLWPSKPARASGQNTSTNFLQVGTIHVGSDLWSCAGSSVYPSKTNHLSSQCDCERLFFRVDQKERP